MSTPPVPEPAALIIDIYRGDVLLRTQRLPPDGVISIGAGSGASVVLDEPGMADVQLIIHRDELGLYQLVELLSTGSRVNGQAGHRAWLPDGSWIAIGGTRLRFWQSEEHRPDPGPPREPAERPVAEGAGDGAPERCAAPPPGDDEALIEDAVLSLPGFLCRGEGSGELGLDRTRPEVLEVVAAWGELVMDVLHFAPGTPEVTIGAETGHRLRILGRPVGWVPPGLSKLAWLAGPGISEVSEELRAALYVPDEALEGATHALFRWSPEGFRLFFRSGWRGALELESGSRLSLGQLIEQGLATSEGGDQWAVTLARGQRLLVELGGVTLSGRLTAAGRRVVAAPELDRAFAGSLIAAAFLGALAAVLIGATRPAPAAAIYELPDRFAEVVLQAPRAERSPAPEPSPRREPAGGAERSIRKESKGGGGRAARTLARGDHDQLDALRHSREVASRAGLLGYLASAGELDGVFSSSALDESVLSGLSGLVAASGETLGSGRGRWGTGPGGGTAHGVGGPGTRGAAGGDADYGADGGLGGSKTTGAVVESAPPILLGGMSSGDIDRVVKQHLSAIRYCYQRELVRAPELSGKVVVKFVIGQDGAVSSAQIKSSSLGNAAVEQCISSRFMTFHFPRPRGGGIVFVSYPFFFAPG